MYLSQIYPIIEWGPNTYSNMTKEERQFLSFQMKMENLFKLIVLDKIIMCSFF